MTSSARASIALGIGIAIAVFLFCAAAAPVRSAEPIADVFPGGEWQRGDPVAEGWSADRLNDAETWSRQIGTTALIVVHHGRIVAQWGDVASQDSARLGTQEPAERAFRQRRQAR